MAEPEPTVDERDAPEVSESLYGLVGALDKLKDTMGVGEEHAAELAQVEQYVVELTTENEQLQRYAEDAILQAQRLRAENDELVAELNQAKLADMVLQTEQLTQVAYEYDKDLVEARVEEAEAVVAEVQELRERVAELEEENAGLAQTLQELRQDQQQLQRLATLDKGEAPAVAGAAAMAMPPAPGAGAGASAGGGGVIGETLDAPPYPIATAMPVLPSQQTPEASTATIQAAVSEPPVTRTLGYAAANDPVAVADALAVAAGGAEIGVAAVAARMLRSHAATQQALDKERQAAQALRAEVEELNETMTTKTFKAPSAWAEREVKYKQDKRRWEEAQKEADGALTALRLELNALRAASGTDALEHRIEELEARLLESERDRDALRAAMHELQLTSRPQAGEFTPGGIAPYSRGRPGEGEVHQAVEQIENSGGTPRRPSNPASPAFGSSGMAKRVEALERENRLLRTQLEQVNHARGSALETPEVVRKAMDVTASAKAKNIQEQLARAETEKAAIKAELDNLTASVPGNIRHAPEVVQLQIRLDQAEVSQDTIRSEVALLQRGTDVETARSLADLEGRLQHVSRREQMVAEQLAAAEQREAALHAVLARPKPLSLNINVKPDSNENPASAPSAGDIGANDLRDQLLRYQEEHRALQAELQAVASTSGDARIVLPIHVTEGSTALPTSEQPSDSASAGEATNVAPAAAARIAQLLTEFSGERAKADDLRRELQRFPAPQQISLPINVVEAASTQRISLPISVTEAVQPPAERISLPINVQEAPPPAAERISLPINVQATPPPAAEHISLPINVQETPPPAAERISLPISVTDAAQPLSLAINVSDHPAEDAVQMRFVVEDAEKQQRINELEALLAAKEGEETRLRADLQAMAPIRLNFNVGSGESPGGMPAGAAKGLSRISSGGSLTDAGDALARDRAEADAAWEEHLKSSDVPSLMRAKAGLEARCQVMQSQLLKLQGALETADTEKGLMQESIDTEAECTAQSKGERSNLRRQLAHMSLRQQRVPSRKGDVSKSTLAEGVSAADLDEDHDDAAGDAASLSCSEASQKLLEDAEVELLSLRDENLMLMEHLVTSKVRLAEVEGDFLESRRALLRAREKQVQMARQLTDLQASARQAEAAMTPPPPTERRRMRIPGLTS